MNIPFQRALRIAACALILGAAAGAQAEQVNVRLDTSAYAGAGFLDLQFNPGANTAAASSAVLSGFSGRLGGTAEASGAVSGALPGTVNFFNSTPYNDLFQSVVLGGRLSFLLNFNGDYLAEGFGSGSVFAVSLYGADGMTALGNVDPFTNALISIDLAAASLGGLSIGVSDASLASASVQAIPATQVPEPAGILLMLAGGSALLWSVRRRRG